MSTALTTPATTPAESTAPLKTARMSFGRWFRVVGWRHLVTVVVCIWGLFPVVYVINLAFSGSNSLTGACPSDKSGLSAITCIFPSKFSWANFQALLSSDQWPFLRWMRNSLIICTVNAGGALLMGACAAFAFSRLRFRGRRIGLLLLMLVQMFPAVLAITAIYTLVRQIGASFSHFGIGTIWGLTLVYLGGALGVNTFLMKGYFDTIPVDIDESARIDGAGHARIFFGLLLRLATPILIVVFFVTFNANFNELPIASIVMPDNTNTTVAVGLNSLVSNPLIQNWGLMAAGGLMMAIPLFALFLATQKYLVTGLTAGAVKG
jgi:arabinogalactan oligomer / maltooligosaccharide transport system permease protein